MRLPANLPRYARAISLAALVSLLAPPATPPAGAAAASPEYLIKAEFLYRFAMFVDWPADAFASPQAPLAIGILGADPFGTALDYTVRDKRINNRPLVVRRLQWGQDLRQCQIIFLTAADAARIGELAQRVDTLPILVVGDSDGLARRGATINFRIDDNRVRFDINRDAAQRARLRISPNLLELARLVTAAPPAGSALRP